MKKIPKIIYVFVGLFLFVALYLVFQLAKTDEPIVTFLGPEQNKFIDITINYDSSYHCNHNVVNVMQLRNGQTIEVDCQNRYLPFIRRNFEVEVTGLLTKDLTLFTEEQLFETVYHELILPHFEYKEAKHILFFEGEDGIHIVILLIMGDDAFNAHFYNRVYFDKDLNFYCFKEGTISELEQCTFGSIRDMHLSYYDDYVQAYIDSGYLLVENPYNR